MKKTLKNPSNFEDCMSGADFAEVAQKRGVPVKFLGNTRAAFYGEHGIAILPATDRHLPKTERRKYVYMLRWIGIALLLGVLAWIF